jgi:ankyrin repeat protein
MDILASFMNGAREVTVDLSLQMIKPYLRNGEPPPDEKMLDEIQAEFGFEFPPTYRAFLLEQNGGTFAQDVVYVEDGDEDDEDKWCFVRDLYGVSTERIVADADRGLVWHLKILRDRIPEEFIPIGSDYGGDQYCLGVRDPYTEMVWDWFHEGDEAGSLANMSFVCNSFTRFLEGLRFAPDIEYEETLPVFQAIERADGERLRSLIRQGETLETRNADGLTPLLFAAKIGQSNVVQVLLESDSELEARDPTGKTALALAASGSVDIVEMLLRAGAEVDARDSIGQTPLMHTAGAWSPRVLKRLIEAGADVNATREDGLSPLMLCLLDLYNRQVLLNAGAKVYLGPVREYAIPESVPADWSVGDIKKAIGECWERIQNAKQRMLELGNREGDGDKLQLELNFQHKLRVRLKELRL